MRIILLLIISAFFISCSQDTMITPPVDSSSSGKLNFTLDKTTIPSNVAVVKVILSRDSLEDISGIMDITSSTTAQIQFKDIKPGLWHIKVDAYNSSEIIIYSGETDVTVIEDRVTDIHLTLNPISTGLGSININVNWGTSNSLIWEDKYGPIFTGNLNYQMFGVYQPHVIYDEGIYKMWYAGLNPSGQAYIFFAYSFNGINWVKHPYPVLNPGYYNTWDSYAVGHPTVTKINGKYYMYYRGESDTQGNWNIGLATSTDGISWSKMNSPIIKGTTGTRYQLFPNEILYVNNKFYLYYSAGDNYRPATAVSNIYLATSTNGVDFVEEPNPVIVPDQPWEGNPYYQASVIHDKNDGKFKMVFIYYNSLYIIGYAESEDGRKWIKGNQPIFSANLFKDKWSPNIANLSFIKVGSEYRIYYAATTQDLQTYKIGVLTTK